MYVAPKVKTLFNKTGSELDNAGNYLIKAGLCTLPPFFSFKKGWFVVVPSNKNN